MTRHADIQAIIDRQDASELARERCRVLMQVISGDLTMEAAATQLGISRQRLHELRERMTAVSVASLEPQSPGRPAAPAPDAKDDEIAQLRAELGRTKRDLDCAMIRAEIAMVFGDRLGSKKNSMEEPVLGSERSERNRRRRATRRSDPG
jgi:hypothetical protein